MQLPYLDLGALVHDALMGALCAVPILAAMYFTRFVGEEYKWVNRKLIHFSTVPAVLAYLYLFKTPVVWFLASLALTLVTLYPHLRNKEFSWFQIRHNYGEVYFCLMYMLLGTLFFYTARWLAAMAMLFLAVGDGVTGITRFYVLRRHREAIEAYEASTPRVRRLCKSFAGTLAFILSGLVIGYAFLGVLGGAVAVAAAAAEKQPYIDDNIAIPLVVIGLAFLLAHALPL